MPHRAELDLLAEALQADAPVTIGTMFRSPGIRVDGKIVAFLGHDDELILKVPSDRARELVDTGAAAPVTMGARTMREWVSVPGGDDSQTTLARWAPLAREALSYVRELSDG